MEISKVVSGKGKKLFDMLCEQPWLAPVGFSLDGNKVVFLPENLTDKSLSETNGIITLTAAFKLNEDLKVKLTARHCIKYGETEFFAVVSNNGAAASPVISDFISADTEFECAQNAVLKGIGGDYDKKYEPYEMPLNDYTPFFLSTRGRPTHVFFPYFNLDCGNCGWLISIGWGGTWSARFESESGKVRFTAKNCVGFESVLLPGESIRTALMVILPYNKTCASDEMNLWRRWFIEYNMPRANRSGDEIKPFTTACFASDTGLPNSDGSISERAFTWKPTMDKILAEKIPLDFRWFDAGWYCAPDNSSVAADWYHTVGTWELDKEKWGGNSFRESVEYGHAHGIKTLVWFEPERVSDIENLALNYGYNKDWATANGHENGDYGNNLGNPECFEWTKNRILKFMRENDVDMYREDYNADQACIWQLRDETEEKQTALRRRGITENKAVEGHYRLWDAIIADCAERDKCTFVDCCASGGGRNDIESLRRGIPLLRSDSDRTTLNLRLSMTTSFNFWIPFCGSSTKETTGELDDSRGSDEYAFRASFLPAMNLSENWSKNKELNFDAVRAYIAEWQKAAPLLLKDMYLLTPWQNRSDSFGITCFAYYDDAKKTGVLFAFRKENADADTVRVKLAFADADSVYKLTEQNSPAKRADSISGQQLRSGFSLRLPEKRSCRIIYMEAE